MTKIRELRMAKNLTAKEAAVKLKMPYTTYINYEKGTREPNSETLISLANFFGVTVDFLIGNPISVGSDIIVKTEDNEFITASLDTSEGKLLNEFQALSRSNKDTLIEMAKLLLKKQKSATNKEQP